MLETVREYAAERLTESGEVDTVARAHVEYLTALAERAEAELRGDGQARWLQVLGRERDDIDAALAWCLEHAAVEPDAGLRLVAPLGWYWYFATNPDGGRRVAAMLAAAGTGSTASRARALQALAVAARPGACIVHPNPDCAAAAVQSRVLFAELGDEFRSALSDTLLAVEAIGSDDPAEAFALLEQSDLWFAQHGETWCAALADFVRLELHAGIGDLTAATAVARRALVTFRTVGDQWGVSAIQFHLGMALHGAGRLEDALTAYEDALTSVRDVGPANTVQYALAGAGLVSLLLEDPNGAAERFSESHAVARQLGAAGNPRAAVGEGLLARDAGDLTAAPGAADGCARAARRAERAGLVARLRWSASATSPRPTATSTARRSSTGEHGRPPPGTLRHSRAWHASRRLAATPPKRPVCWVRPRHGVSGGTGLRTVWSAPMPSVPSTTLAPCWGTRSSTVRTRRVPGAPETVLDDHGTRVRAPLSRIQG